MRDKILYFPYINVPESAWLTRMLLYWDEIGVIMPYDFIKQPERLEEHTRNLVQANLLSQIVPNDYISDIPEFAVSFTSYLHSLGPHLTDRQNQFSQSENELRSASRRSIHLEKLGATPIHLEKTRSILAGALVDLNLATYVDYPWLAVEIETAREFMYYLAIVLGKHPDLQLTPATDDRGALNAIASLTSPADVVDSDLENLRLAVLEDILPAPAAALPVIEIELFKRRHGEKLKKFRRSIEIELTQIADMTDPALRHRRLELFKEGLVDEIEEIQAKMRESKWPQIIFGKLAGVLGAVPVMGTFPALVNAVYEAIGNHSTLDTSSPLAYAAYARHDLFCS
jgi:hypothetical protein